MQFIKSADSTAGESDLIGALNKALEKGPVLWLVSGGSNIEIEARVSKSIKEELSVNLSVFLVDERLGPRGHKDSNYLKLIDAGFDIKKGNFRDILEGYQNPEETLLHYSQAYTLAAKTSYIVAELGIGDDGHIAGVLPSSPGVSSSATAVYYDWPPYKRLTLTLKSLGSVDETFVFCFGYNKKEVLLKLKEGQDTVAARPSLVLSQLKDVKVYNDQLEENR